MSDTKPAFKMDGSAEDRAAYQRHVEDQAFLAADNSNVAYDADMRDRQRELDAAQRRKEEEERANFDKEVQTRVDSELAAREMRPVAERLAEDYPILNHEHKDFDQGLTDEVIAMRNIEVRVHGKSYADALESAAKVVLTKHGMRSDGFKTRATAHKPVTSVESVMALDLDDGDAMARARGDVIATSEPVKKAEKPRVHDWQSAGFDNKESYQTAIDRGDFV
ncbi:hypothetical protein EDB69_3205 [Vibrio crassostreae]|uniref:hypothetical protein n=1 Tax=Vibrio crassostreae TaxID=246167 RepID=UPI000F46E6CB|nr:hypothetical protein [Vibrio crassostreae]ROO70420.1 hypothetical protein EDB64_2925 [Vibrio crassostreae]ROP08651.1 hypothetical protein EDB63_2655 [Vibrio crassostreae]RPE91449.1 hypothetical protein EDB68_2658 [Vibrio crassostreae]RPF14716.1 hypothetical protein EDB69_3205 [Vibrio crassostreae]